MTTLSGVAIPPGDFAFVPASGEPNDVGPLDGRTGQEELRLYIELARELATRLGLASNSQRTT